MVKIKDFTLASQNLGGGAFDPPCPTHRAPMVGGHRSRAPRAMMTGRL